MLALFPPQTCVAIARIRGRAGVLALNDAGSDCPDLNWGPQRPDRAPEEAGEPVTFEGVLLGALSPQTDQ